LSGELVQKELSDADLLMAAQAAVEGAVLVTSDMALRRIPSVSAKDWNEVGPQ
jgi:predicted nucleic acid-binding protein